MADEPNIAMGRTPGMGSGSSASPAAASRIRVDIADVQKLKTAIKDTATETKKLADAVGSFDTKLAAIKRANQQLAEMKQLLGSAGTGRVRSTSTATATTSSPSGSYLPTDVIVPAAAAAGTVAAAATAAGTTTQPAAGGGSYLSRFMSWTTRPSQPTGAPRGGGGGGSRLAPWATTPAARASLAILGGVPKLAEIGSAHIPEATDRSYLLNTYQITTGGSASTAAQTAFGAGLAGRMGNTALNYGDVTSALGTLMQSGVTGGSYGQSRFSGVGFLSTINPLQGNAASAQQMAQTYTPQNYYAMRLAGVNASIANGQHPQQLFDQIIRRIEGSMGRPATLQEIQSGSQVGTHLNADLTAFGLTPDMMQNLLRYWAARNRSGRSGVAAMTASGATNNLGRAVQQAGTASANAWAKVDIGGMGGAEASMRGRASMYNLAGDAAASGLGQAFTRVVGGLSAFSGALSKATHLLEMLAAMRLGGMLLGGGAAATEAGASGGLLRGLFAGAGLRTAASFAGRAVGAGGLTAAGLLAGHGIDAIGQATGHTTWGTIGGDVARGAGVGAGIGLLAGPFSPLTAPIGAGIGAGAGAVVGARHQIASAASDVGSYVTGLFGGGTHPSASANGDGSNGGSGVLTGGMGEAMRVIHAAEQYLGTPYRYGGASPRTGFDCSGLVQYAYKRGGITLPRTASEQQKFAKRIDPSKTAPGDLLFLGNPAHHVMMSIGGGKVIEAPHTGDNVKIIKFPADSATSVGRVIGGVGTSGAINPNSNSGGDSGDTTGQTSSATSASFLGDLFSTSSADALLAALGATGGTGAGAGASSPTSASSSGGGGSAASYSYTGKGSVSEKNMFALAEAAGFTHAQARIMAAIGMAESGGNPRDHNSNAGTGDNSYGLWQINMLGSMGPGRAKEFGISNYNQLFDPKTNAHAAHMIFGGSGFNAWSTYKDGAYKQYLNSYDKGSWHIVQDELAKLHKDEMVVPAPTATAIRQMVDTPSGGGGSSHRGRRRAVPVQLVFQMSNGTEAEARQHAARFAKYVEEDHDIEMVAGS